MRYGLGKVEESVELWFSDNQTDHVKVSVKVEKQLFGEQTDFQRIDVFESREFGRFLSSDGSIVFSDKDEFIYDEMIVHVPMAVHPHVKKVLVIGGGDGGVARELSYYEEIEQIDVCLLYTSAFRADHAFFMVGGTTSSVQSMVLSVCRAGDKIILPRNVHTVSYTHLDVYKRQESRCGRNTERMQRNFWQRRMRQCIQ